MSSTSTGHTRNVAGHKLTQITKYAYEQALANGKRRWYIKFKKSDGKGYIWKVTRAFKDKAQYINQKPYRTLTDAVLAANE